MADREAPAGASPAAAGPRKTDSYHDDHGPFQRMLRYVARVIVDRPCQVALGSIFCILICVILAGSQPFLVDAGGATFRAETDWTAINFDTVQVATLDVISPPKTADFVQPERALAYGSISLIYEADGDDSALAAGGMLSAASLRAICTTESALTATPNFGKYCIRPSPGFTGTCASPISIMSMLFELDAATGLPQYDCAGITDADATRIQDTILNAPDTRVNNTGVTSGAVASYFKPTLFTADNRVAEVTRSLVVFGFPLANYNNTDVPSPTLRGAPSMRASATQVAEFDAWATTTFLDKLDELADNDLGLAVRFRGTGINDIIFQVRSMQRLGLRLCLAWFARA